MRMMATGVHLLSDDTYKETVRTQKENGEDIVKKFKYKLPFYWSSCYRHEVNNYNNLRHAHPSIKDTCMIDRWECQLFAFIFSI